MHLLRKERFILPLLVAGVFAMILFACGGGGGGADDDGDDDSARCGACDSPNACCTIGGNDFCIDISSDLQNCGGCGMLCNAATADNCGGSDCKCGAGPECGAGQGCCDGGCKDTSNDSNNCGGCGNVCGEGTTCSNGSCLCGGVACDAGESCCNGVCSNTQLDTNNCGECGTVCSGTGAACTLGACGCEGGGSACPAEGPGVVTACCTTGCVDTCTDANNCGGCGIVCASGCFFGGCPEGGGPSVDCINLPF
jgi:hypothetical protein